METKDLLTVKEFAEAAGVTRQTIYSQIDRGVLSEFVIENDGVKMIDRKALSKFTVKRQSSDSQFDSKNDSQFDSQIELITALRERIAAQEKELERKQHTIDDLMKAVIAAQQLQYEEKRERLQLLEVAEAAPQEQSSGAAAQESGEPSADEGTGLNPTQEAQSETRAETAPEPVKKKGLLNRLFGRR